jgi:hypothetical protein
MEDEIRKLEEITGMTEPEPDPGDLWSLFDTPHVRTLGDPAIFLSFARSKSTESVSCSSVAGLLNFRATGPHGGKVNFVAASANLDPDTRHELRKIQTEANVASPARA